jgi:multiple antibiotic resistance protein
MFDFSHFVQAIPLSYAALFPVLNPIGTAFIFLALSNKLTPVARRGLALRIAINSFILLTIVLWVGEWVLRFFGVGIPVVQVAGGLVLATIGWQMMSSNGPGNVGYGKEIANEAEGNAQAFFPLTMPLTAGPGSLAVSLTIGAHENAGSLSSMLIGKAGAVIGILLASITVYFCYSYAHYLTKKLGTTGTNVIIKLSAFIIFCIGLTILFLGIQDVISQWDFSRFN